MRRITTLWVAFVTVSGCTTAPKTVREPTGRATATPAQVEVLEATQLVKLDRENRALFALKNERTGMFSIAECKASDTDVNRVLAKGARCKYLTDQWIPDQRDFIEQFNRAFNQAAVVENEKLAKNDAKRHVAYLALGAFVGITSVGAAWKYTSRIEAIVPPGPLKLAFYIVSAVGTGIGGAAAATEYHHRNTPNRVRSVETDLLNLNPNIADDDLQYASREVYNAIRRCLLAAMDARPTA